MFLGGKCEEGKAGANVLSEQVRYFPANIENRVFADSNQRLTFGIRLYIGDVQLNGAIDVRFVALIDLLYYFVCHSVHICSDL